MWFWMLVLALGGVAVFSLIEDVAASPTTSAKPSGLPSRWLSLKTAEHESRVATRAERQGTVGPRPSQ